jgi:sulfur relay (sulfurtransferase) DsrC/TusE family protein
MPTQLSMGRKVEREHTRTLKFLKNYVKKHGKFPPNKIVFEHIAKDHIQTEDKKYYTKLKNAGL